jgi:hypothetical protein
MDAAGIHAAGIHAAGIHAAGIHADPERKASRLAFWSFSPGRRS